MSYFYTFDPQNDYFEFIKSLVEDYPMYFHQPKRLADIIALFRYNGEVTAIVETDYVDKQYRDSYYAYYSQKYSDYRRNCVRVAFFEGALNIQQFISKPNEEIESRFIGTIVFRPLNTGMIGQTFLDPLKLKVEGFFQTCQIRSLVCGRKLTVRAFPFSSQDAETMTCAETSLYNLIKYYAIKYSEYRELMPIEILTCIESTYYERVLPSLGISEEYIAKVLSESHFYPRLYTGVEGFSDLINIYAESGMPFIWGLPGHVVNCIGHGKYKENLTIDQLEPYVECREIDDKNYYFLSDSALIDGYIVMDDNKAPYYKTTLNEITAEYYIEVNPDSEGKIINSTLREVIKETDAIIVPLPRRIFIDAARAKQIYESCFLTDPWFLDDIIVANGLKGWGTTPQNPFVWRIFLTTSNKYKDYKVRSTSNQKLVEHYMSSPFPRFIWVLEIGSISSYENRQAYVEIILDATSSIYSENWGILSIAYNKHFIFVPSISKVINSQIKKMNVESSRPELSLADQSLSCEWEEAPDQSYLTAIFHFLYNELDDSYGERFRMFNNLEEE